MTAWTHAPRSAERFAAWSPHLRLAHCLIIGSWVFQVPANQLAKGKPRIDSQLSGRLNKVSSPTKNGSQDVADKSFYRVMRSRDYGQQMQNRWGKRAKSTKQLSHQGSLTSDTVDDVSGGSGDQIYMYISNTLPAPSLPEEPPACFTPCTSSNYLFWM